VLSFIIVADPDHTAPRRQGQPRGSTRGSSSSNAPSSRGGASTRGGGRGGGNAGNGAGGERQKKEAILNLAKYQDKEVRIKFQGGREGESNGRHVWVASKSGGFKTREVRYSWVSVRYRAAYRHRQNSERTSETRLRLRDLDPARSSPSTRSRAITHDTPPSLSYRPTFHL